MIKRLLIPLRGILSHPLTRRRRLRAFGRFLLWQLRSRLNACVNVAFVNDAKLQVSAGMTGLTGNIYTGLHEFESMGFLLHLLRSNDLFVDVGANAGSYTVLAGKAIGCEVISVEPAPAALTALRANIALNDMAGRVEVHDVVLADQAGTLRFTRDCGAANHVATATEAAGDTAALPVKTLDQVLHGRGPALIKLDVEGYELKVLNGGIETLKSPRLLALIVEINGSDMRYQLRADDLVGLLRLHGFTGHAYDPMQRKLLAVDPLRADGNVIFVRDPGAIEAQLARAPAFELPDWKLSI